MLDLRFVCENIEAVKAALAQRNGNFPIDKVAGLAEERRSIIRQVEQMKSDKNRISDRIAEMKRQKQDAAVIIEEMKKLGVKIKELDETLAGIENELAALMYSIPNIPSKTTPAGKTDADNVVVRKYGAPRVFDFAPKPHWELGEQLNLLDWPRAGKISGARFTVYKDAAARLERSVMNFMLDTHTANGYVEVFPPFMVNSDSMRGTGQLPKFEEDMFRVAGTDYYLVPTAEVPITNLHKGETLDPAMLPIKYTAYTACFRAEAGSAGRDTRGLIRQHQFNKVELVKFVHPAASYDELESLTADAEKILRLLDIPYRVSALCTGDVGFCSAKTYDLEVWMPSYDRYVEISSCSNFEDFQARRANIKFKENGKNYFVHTLNGSGLAIGRTTAAIMENYQNADGSITVPEALRKYMGTDRIETYKGL